MSQKGKRYVRYLDAAREGKQIELLKKKSIRWLELEPGDRVLEVGCGTGEDVITMESQVQPHGLVIGLDILSTMITQARMRAQDSGCSFLLGDAHALPCADSSFSACRVERTLQHTRDPRRVVQEMVRVLEPGGRVVATEPDWGTLVIDSPLRGIGQEIVRNRLRKGISADVGRKLYGLFVAAGLSDVSIEGHMVPYLTYAADFFFHGLERVADEAVQEEVVSMEDAHNWIRSLKELDSKGQFFFGVTLFSAIGHNI